MIYIYVYIYIYIYIYIYNISLVKSTHFGPTILSNVALRVSGHFVLKILLINIDEISCKNTEISGKIFPDKMF